MSRLIAPTGHTLDLPSRHLTFGESPQCDIPLTAGYGLAALHFEIAPGSDGLFYLRDASGGPGTLVNGQPASVTVLKEGDVITAGQLTLRFSSETPPSPPSAEAPAHVAAGSGKSPLSATLPPRAPLAVAVPAAPPAVRLPSAGETITSADATSSLPSAADPIPTNGRAASASPLLKRKPTPERRPSAAPSPLVLRVACGVLLVLAAAAFCATDPGQRLISPMDQQNPRMEYRTHAKNENPRPGHHRRPRR